MVLGAQPGQNDDRRGHDLPHELRTRPKIEGIIDQHYTDDDGRTDDHQQDSFGFLRLTIDRQEIRCTNPDKERQEDRHAQTTGHGLLVNATRAWHIHQAQATKEVGCLGYKCN
jgi:hypothetical protein